MKEDGGPAYPVIDRTQTTGEYDEIHNYRMESYGMSLRDYFAGQALTGLLAANTQERYDEEWMAVSAYSIADAMLTEREREK